MTTRDVGIDELLTPDKTCTEHVITFQYYIGLPITDDPLIGEKVTNFEFSKFDQKEKLFPADQEKLERENIATLERVYLV